MLLNLDKHTELILQSNISKYKGLLTTLESALGALIIGQQYGWRVLKIVHNPTTYRKYEQILGIKFKDHCPERTEMSRKSVGLSIADKYDSFWAVVKGKIDAPKKGHIK